MCRSEVAPHQAAEGLIDTNGDGVKTDREFAGSHRYNTAVALAQRFAADEGAVSTVIIASGETEVDAVTAAGLAGNLNAAVLLTRSNQLPHNVARFIDEQNVTDVIVVGGTAAVPDAIVTAIEGLDSRPSVERISGADRYATAAAIGDRLGGPNPTWCGSDQSAAILVNGGSDGRADAVISGPLAFRLGLPILLTGADMLPESTASFLTDNKVERVVVVGGMGAVSGGIVDELVEEVGVVNVRRISGGSAAATSVMVAKEMLGNCADVLSTNPDRVALINRDATADGITAAPVLGRGLGDGGPVPILLVGDDLPAAVRDYLASTAEVRAGQKTDLGIVAIGGTAVVSNMVMADAVAAAKTSSMLTAEITPLKYTGANAAAGTIPAGKAVGDYTRQFRVTFSDDVKTPTETAGGVITAEEARGTVVDPTMYRINNRRLEASTEAASPVDEPVTVRNLVFTADRTVTITLSHHLAGGNTITVDNSDNEATGGRLGANDDKRTLERAELKLAAVSLPVDRTAPAVEIIAVPGQNYFDVIVTEPNLLHNELGTLTNGVMTALGTDISDFVEIRGVPSPADETLTDTTEAGAAHTPRKVLLSNTLHAGNVADFTVGGSGGTIRMRFGITVTNPNDPVLTGQLADAGLDDVLRAGDVIMVKGSAFLDRRGLRSRLAQLTVPKIKSNTPPGHGTGNLKIESVSIGDYVHTANATAIIGNASAGLTVAALPTGVAAGAAGNDWVIYGYDDRDDGAASSFAFDIDVNVDIAHQRISYTLSDAVPSRPIPGGQGPTLAHLASALVSNSDFAANFSVDYVRAADRTTTQSKATPLGATSAAGVQFGDDVTATNPEVRGRTAVGVLVKFNADISTLLNGGTDLAYDIAPGGANGFPTGLTEGATATDALPNAYDVKFQAPDDVVKIRYESDSMRKLPTRSGFRVIAADIATGWYDGTRVRGYGWTDATRETLVATATPGVGNVRYIVSGLRLDSNIKP